MPETRNLADTRMLYLFFCRSAGRNSIDHVEQGTNGARECRKGKPEPCLFPEVLYRRTGKENRRVSE